MSRSPARLSPATLAAQCPGAVPPYDRSGSPPIVHIGVGAFARAHLGTYADELLRAGHPALIRGVSLATDRAERQLAPQGCLYTVTEREPGHRRAPAVIGSFQTAGTGPTTATEAIRAATTRIVTLTITEKGYDLDPADGRNHGSPRSAPAVIAHALAGRDRTLPPPVFAPLDNLPHNGRRLRAAVVEAAEHHDPPLARWIEEEVRFANSVVDRMVPATTVDDRREVATALGLADDAAVICEHHRSWVIDEVPADVALGDAGVEVVPDVEPHQRRKLWLLNGPHSAIAYCGLLTGHDTIADSLTDPRVSAFIGPLVDQILEVAALPERLEARSFATATLERFANPALGHLCRQVAADGSRKIPERLLPVVERRRERGLATDRFALVVAIWLAALGGVPVHGAVLPALEDPVAPDVRARATNTPPRARALAALGGAIDLQFADEVAAATEALSVAGVAVLDPVR